MLALRHNDPPSGYSNVRYYNFPEVVAYYDTKKSNFIYISGNSWVHRSSLPNQYINYDLYNGYKVVLPSYRGNWPHSYYKQHRAKYANGYKGNGNGNNMSNVKKHEPDAEKIDAKTVFNYDS